MTSAATCCIHACILRGCSSVSRLHLQRQDHFSAVKSRCSLRYLLSVILSHEFESSQKKKKKKKKTNTKKNIIPENVPTYLKPARDQSCTRISLPQKKSIPNRKTGSQEILVQFVWLRSSKLLFNTVLLRN
ncbi:hypothetical protein I7I50_00066 [Histoplasma capsulatum G186AR]|nr:hypothetical protein I7I50_00066 [Histoplasma capsulatum G186AR]